jgi:hypothetical protein
LYRCNTSSSTLYGPQAYKLKVYEKKMLRTVFQDPVLALVVFLKKVSQTKNDIPIRNKGTGRTRSTIHAAQTQQFIYHTKSATCFGLYIAIIKLTTKKMFTATTVHSSFLLMWSNWWRLCISQNMYLIYKINALLCFDCVYCTSGCTEGTTRMNCRKDYISLAYQSAVMQRAVNRKWEGIN